MELSASAFASTGSVAARSGRKLTSGSSVADDAALSSVEGATALLSALPDATGVSWLIALPLAATASIAAASDSVSEASSAGAASAATGSTTAGLGGGAGRRSMR